MGWGGSPVGKGGRGVHKCTNTRTTTRKQRGASESLAVHVATGTPTFQSDPQVALESRSNCETQFTLHRKIRFFS